MNVLKVSGHYTYFESEWALCSLHSEEGNTKRYTNYCKQMMQILHLSIYHTTLLVTQGNIFNLHMIKGRIQS